MTFYPVQSPYPIFTDEDGTPLKSGYIYIGEANLNPITNPITASWDIAGLYPAAQPIRTIGGYPDRNGSPGKIYINAGQYDDAISYYSILVQDKHGNLVHQNLATEFTPVVDPVNIENISSLRAIDAYSLPLYLRGHTTIGDGGADFFEYFDGQPAGTYTDDNGYTIRPSGGDGSAAYLRQSFSVVNISHFGGIGDGSTDNLTAFNNAINYALTLNTKHPAIYIPAGSFYVSDTISIDGYAADRFTIFGDGRQSDIFCDQNVATLDLSATSGTFQYATLKNIAIRNTHATGIAVQTRNTEFFKMYNCTIVGNTGLLMSINGGESDIKPTISNNLFSGGTYGIRGGDTRVADAFIRDNLFIDSTGTMMEFGYLDGGTIAGNKMFSNNAGTNAVVGLRLKKPIYTQVNDNAFFELGGSAIVLTTPRYSRIKDNKIVNVGQNANATAISVSDYDAITEGVDVQFKGNTIKDTNGSGISINSANTLQSRYLIKDNYFYNVGDVGTGDAIQLTKCTDFVIENNYIDGNSVTRYWLYLDASTSIRCIENKYVNCTQADIFRANGPTAFFGQANSNNFTVIATTTLTFNDDTVLCNATAGAITINLPAAGSAPGKIYRIGKLDATANAVIIDPISTQTVDGALTLSITTQWQVVTIMSDGSGTNWITISI